MDISGVFSDSVTKFESPKRTLPRGKTIQDVPPEVLGDIFAYAVFADQYDVSAESLQQSNLEKGDSRRRRLVAVDATWRRAAVDHSVLWVFTVLYQGHSLLWACLCLQRSKLRPVSIFVSQQSHKIDNDFHRWSFEVSSSVLVPNMSKLEVLDLIWPPLGQNSPTVFRPLVTAPRVS